MVDKIFGESPFVRNVDLAAWSARMKIWFKGSTTDCVSSGICHPEELFSSLLDWNDETEPATATIPRSAQATMDSTGGYHGH
jgi:hypothetical protein